MNPKMIGIICVILNCLLLPFGQFFWKKAMINGYSWSTLISSNFLLGCAFFIVGTLLWLYALSVFPLSKVYPFVSLSFLVGTLMGVYWLGEKVNAVNYAGVALLMLSLFLIVYKY